MTIRNKITNFLENLSKEENITFPRFAHNQNAPANKVYYAGPYFDNNELSAAIEALLVGRWSSAGEICNKFEKQFAKAVNQTHAVFTNSGSSANLIMIASLKEYFGWQDGDEIIVSPVGFPTTITSIIQNNLKPVFVDIEWDTLNFDLDKIDRYLEKLWLNNLKIPKAIFISPVLGNPPDFRKLEFFKIIYGVELILDCCDSLKSEYLDKQLPEWCVASSFSFYPAHEITTLEGGMVTSNNEEIIKLARSYMQWGRACYCVGTANLAPNGTCGCRFNTWLEGYPEPIDHRYCFDRMGYNLKPLDLQAAIGLEQLKKLDYICEKRGSNLVDIESLFIKYIKEISPVHTLNDSDWVPFAVPLICKTKELKYSLVAHLEKNGIQTRNYFAGNILLHKPFRHLDDYQKYPNANEVLSRVFFVGCAPTITDENIKYIEEVLKKYEL